MKEAQFILSQKIEKIATSDQLLAVCKKNELYTLGEVLQNSIDVLLKKPGFNLHLIMELITIFKGNKLEQLLKEDS